MATSAVMTVIIVVFLASALLSLSLLYCIERFSLQGATFGILGLALLVCAGFVLSGGSRGEAVSGLETGRYHVYACARHGKTQHCLLDKLGDDENTVRYYTFSAAIEEDPDIRVHGTYPPRRIIFVWEQNGKKIVFMPTHLIYDWPGDHS